MNVVISATHTAARVPTKIHRTIVLDTAWRGLVQRSTDCRNRLHFGRRLDCNLLMPRRAPILWMLLGLLCGPNSATSPRQGGTQPPDITQQSRGPLSPAEALASFQLEAGYRIELAAAEPLIESPVAMAFDDRGRMYVVENRGYPGPLEGAAGQPPAEGVIALLDDVNRDGRFDKRTDFAANLTFPNGIMPWDGGVFVTCAPDLLYLKDTTGDGIADVRRVVLTGFDPAKTTQLRFSHPTLGIDNRVYLTSGLTGGRVTAPDHPDRPAVILGTTDSRFNPLTLEFEAAGGQGQYGLTFDDYGRRFICSNRRPVMHVVLEPRYLKRNPHLAFSDTVEDVSAAGARAGVWPISGDVTTASFIPGLMSAPHAGTFTAASGVHVHRGDALPADHRDSVFVCESAQNLVQRQVLSVNGVTFASKPAHDGREFLASRDQWFRPVFAANGPDGGLYVVDMYRKFIDHPQYVPEQSRALFDFEAGRERGRIYRIVAGAWKRAAAPIDASRMGAGELSRMLEHPNAWWREIAQRLLIERQDRGAVPFLRRVAKESRHAAARVHAIWTLDGIGALQAADIELGLRDEVAAVRENAVRLAETRLSGSTALATRVMRLADDPDDRVRLRVALALGETSEPGAIAALAAIARRDGAQRWVRAAVLSSAGQRSTEFLQAFMASPSPPDVRIAVMRDLGQVLGAGQPAEQCLDLIARIAGADGDGGWQPAALAGIAQGLRVRGLAQANRTALMTLLTTDSPQARVARVRVQPILSRSLALALDGGAPADQRLAAVALLGQTDDPTAGDVLQALLAPQHPPDLQLAAAGALSALPDRAAADRLVEQHGWEAFTPQLREAVLSALMADDPHALVLLDALERRAIAVTALGPTRRARLMNHRNAEIQKRARALFAGVESGDRMQAYERLRGPVLDRVRDAANGSRIFAAHCAACHSAGGKGGEVGPDLGGIRNQPADAILLHVLVPDYEISAGYQAYVVETRDRRTLVGRLMSETPTSVTLRDGSSRDHVILRTDVVSMSASLRSLMPSELERAMSEQELADLIGYLKAEVRPR